MFHRLFAIFSICCAFAAPVHAETQNFQDVLSAATLDFNNDAKQDRAVLVNNKDGDVDLYLYLSKEDPNSEPLLTLAEMKKSAAFSGLMWGQLPSLAVSGEGSLLIKSGNESIGRDRWEQTLTLVYRNNEFLIAGITYAARDTLDPKRASSCDINLLSGKGLRNGKPVDRKFTPIRLADWSDDKLPVERQPK
jgi:hypothetical protein